MIRSVTAIGVVGVHAVAFTVILTHTEAGLLAQNAVVSALHFTREIFLAITAFVLVYGYANRPFSTRVFWRKRGLGVVLPYVVWSVFYELATKPPLPPGQWLLRMAGDLLTGSASFQLYYILLTLEFYLVLPWFLWLIVHAGRRPWLLLGVSGALQVALLTLDYRYVETGPFSTTALGAYINLNQARFLPMYQFYAVLGGVAALYLPQVRAFVLRHGRWTIAVLALGLAMLWGDLLYQVEVSHMSIGYGITVFQPAMVVYAIGIATFFYWIAWRWAISRAPQAPRGARFWGLLSDTSFGIYLVQAIVLDQVIAHVVPVLPTWTPEPLRVGLIWALVASVTVGICVVFLYTPVLSRLIGRPWALRRDRGVGRWFVAASQRLAPSQLAPNWRQSNTVQPAPAAAPATEPRQAPGRHDGSMTGA